MIWLNTYADLKKLGYSNYTVEYAELIRRGEITREQALSDLEFNPPKGMLETLAEGVGLNLDDLPQYDPNEKETEVADTNKQEEQKQDDIDFSF